MPKLKEAKDFGNYTVEMKDQKVSLDLIKGLIIQAAELQRHHLVTMYSRKPKDEVDGIFLAKNWKRREKETIDSSMRELLCEEMPELTSEPITLRVFQYETDYISSLVVECFSTNNQVLFLTFHDE